MADQQWHVDYGDIAESLACWGAEIPEHVLTGCILHHSQKVQLAGLSMLNFRSYRLSAKELLNYCNMALQRNIDSINLKLSAFYKKRNIKFLNDYTNFALMARCYGTFCPQSIGLRRWAGRQYLKQLAKT